MKKLIPLVVFLAIFTGCQTNLAALNAALKKTSEATAVEATQTVDITVSANDITTTEHATSQVAIESANDGLKASGNFRFNASSYGEFATIYFNYDFTNNSSPKFWFYASFNEILGVGNTYSLDSDALSQDWRNHFRDKFLEGRASSEEYVDDTNTMLVDIEKFLQEYLPWTQNGNTFNLTIDQAKLDQIMVAIGKISESDLSDISNAIKLGTPTTIDVKTNTEGYISEINCSTNIRSLEAEAEITVKYNGVFTNYNNVAETKKFVTSQAINFADLYDALVYENNIMVSLNAQKLMFPSDSIPTIIDNRTMLPARFLVESMGGQVEYNQVNGVGVVICRLGGRSCTVIIGNTTAYYNIDGKEGVYQMDIAPTIINDRTLVPLRFISELLGKKVDYHYQDFNVYGHNEDLIINITE